MEYMGRWKVNQDGLEKDGKVGSVDKNTFVFSDIPRKPIIPVIHSDHNHRTLVRLHVNQPSLH